MPGPLSPFFSQGDLEDRLSKQVVQQLYDDDGDGAADNSPLERLALDATSKVLSFLGPVFDLSQLDPFQQNELQRLALDIAEVYAAQRFPAYVRKDWVPLLDAAERDLTRLRKGITSLGVQPTPVAGTGRGIVRSGNPQCPTPQPRVFDDMGDFWRGDRRRT